MWTLLFVCMMLAVFGKLIVLAFKATWGITKVFFSLVFLPILLIALVIGGLMYIALPILAIVGIVVLIGSIAGN